MRRDAEIREDGQEVSANTVIVIPDAAGYGACRTVSLVFDNHWKHRPFVRADGLLVEGAAVPVRELIAWLSARRGVIVTLFRQPGRANHHRAEFVAND